MNPFGSMRLRGPSPRWENVVSRIPFDGTNGATSIVDAKGNTWTATGAPTLTTANKQFGTAAGTFNGSNYWSNTTLPVLGTRKFSIQGWFRSTASPAGYQIMVGNYSNTSDGEWVIGLGTAGQITFYNTTTGVFTQGSADSRNSAFHYFSVTRDSNNRVSLSLDGTEVGSTANVTTDFFHAYSAAPLNLGWCTTLGGIVGQVDDFRMVLDEVLPNTVPTAPFPITP